MSAFSLPRLDKALAIITKEGFPTYPFQQWWQSVVEKLEAQEGTQDQLIDDLATAVADITAAQAAADAAQDSADAVAGDLSSYVLRNQTAAWTAATGTAARTALASYAGQTVSNPPTQAEMQALDDAVKAISQHVVALINDLRADVLT